MAKITGTRERQVTAAFQRLQSHYLFETQFRLLRRTDESRSLAVGLSKEATDSTPEGSGFSFVDMAANSAGIRLAASATRRLLGEIDRRIAALPLYR